MRYIKQNEKKREFMDANKRVQNALKKALEEWIGMRRSKLAYRKTTTRSKRAPQQANDLTSEKQGEPQLSKTVTLKYEKDSFSRKEVS